MGASGLHAASWCERKRHVESHLNSGQDAGRKFENSWKSRSEATVGKRAGMRIKEEAVQASAYKAG